MEENLLKTCLYDKHVALNALMSPFGGFIMPIQYTNITDEHNAVRHRAGMFDVSHMGEIFVSGPDAEKFVNHIFTNNVTGIPDGKILYGMMLYPSGTVVDDLLVYKEFEPNKYLLVVNASNIAKDYEWICAQKEGFDVEVVNASDSWGEIALQGPDAEKFAVEVLGLNEAAELGFYTYYEAQWPVAGADPTSCGQSEATCRMIVSRTGYTGEDGFEIYCSHEAINEIWDMLLAAGVAPAGIHGRSDQEIIGFGKFFISGFSVDFAGGCHNDPFVVFCRRQQHIFRTMHVGGDGSCRIPDDQLHTDCRGKMDHAVRLFDQFFDRFRRRYNVQFLHLQRRMIGNKTQVVRRRG